MTVADAESSRAATDVMTLTALIKPALQQHIHPLLKGQPPEVQSAAIARSRRHLSCRCCAAVPGEDAKNADRSDRQSRARK